MNIIAIDIGNSNIAVGLFLDGQEEFIKSIAGDNREELAECLKSAWDQVPILLSSSQGKGDGVIVVSSVKPAWTEMVDQLVRQQLDEQIKLIGRDIPVSITSAMEKTDKAGTDRLVAAAAAYDVVEDAVVVADFGTAVTIDLVDQAGVFLGGVILPGFALSAQALKDNTAQLPIVQVTKPKTPYGRNTAEAINCGLYYAMIGALEEIIRRYAETIGKWPQTVMTGAGAKTIIDDCQFIDSCVPNLVIKGIVLAYKKYIEQKL